MKRILIFSIFLVLGLLFSVNTAKAENLYTCDNPAFEYSRESAACVPKECPAGTHYNYTGTLCLCDDPELQACKDHTTGITSQCIPQDEKCPEANISENNNRENKIEATISKITGDVTYKKGGRGQELPLTEDTVLKEGDVILTDYDSAVLLRFGDFTQVMIHQLSGVRLDGSFTEENIQKTKMYLNIGAISAKVRRTPSIRSDFSVATPGMANASIRNSAMSVTYNESGNTVIFVTEDKAYVLPFGFDEEFEVTEGQRTDINDLGDTETDTYDLNDLPAYELEFDNWSGVFDTVEPETSNNLWIFLVGGICIVLMGIGAGAIILFFFIKPSKKVLAIIGAAAILFLCVATIGGTVLIYSLSSN